MFQQSTFRFVFVALCQLIIYTSEAKENYHGNNSLDTIINECPAVTIDLTTINSTNQPDGTILTWHYSTPCNNSNLISDATMINTSGTYYAAFYHTENDCYSTDPTPVHVLIVLCPGIEICGDGKDNNGNGFIDENDFLCKENPIEKENAITVSESVCCIECPGKDAYVRTPYWYGDGHWSSTEKNLACYKPVYSSSRENRANPFFVTDKIKTSNDSAYDDFMVTQVEENPWVEVDLVGHFNLTDIIVSGQWNCCSTSTYNYSILVSEVPFPDSSFTDILNMNPSPTQFAHTQQGGQPFTINPNITGRYIRIYLNTTDQLRLAEVEVFGNEVPNSNPYDYTWSDSSISNTSNPTCLKNGTYEVTVTNRDTGSTATASININ